MYNYPPVKNATIWKLFVPYCIFLAIFVTYLNIVYDERKRNDMVSLNTIYEIALILSATYIISNEFFQLY